MLTSGAHLSSFLSLQGRQRDSNVYWYFNRTELVTGMLLHPYMGSNCIFYPLFLIICTPSNNGNADGRLYHRGSYHNADYANLLFTNYFYPPQEEYIESYEG